ncbi:MAG: glycine cleavage system protein GcvH [Candidatus Thermoplasmatota archaeon]
MLNVPDDLRYTESHEWVRIEGARARIGITDFAQQELTDVVYVELPEVGKDYKKGEVIAVVESVKSTSDIYAPVSGAVAEINRALENAPEIINQDPYGEGWLAVLSLKDERELGSLLTPEQYRAVISR